MGLLEWVGLHVRSKMKVANIHSSLLTVLCHVHMDGLLKQACSVYMPWGSVLMCATYHTAQRRWPHAALFSQMVVPATPFLALHCVIVSHHSMAVCAKCYNGQNRFGGAQKSQFWSNLISSKNRNFRFWIEYRNNTRMLPYLVHAECRWMLILHLLYAEWMLGECHCT